MIALLCPGQGSQTPGMLEPWLELPGASEYLGSVSEAAKVDLISLGTTADAETIKDTAVAQPLIVAASLLSLQLLTERSAPVTDWAHVTAGHSVGEFTAAAVAGILTATDAVHLTGVRGRAMAEAASQADTGMAAVIGGNLDVVTEAIRAVGLVPANINGGGQVVAAGQRNRLEALAANPPERTRVIPVPVAGAFHTEFMSDAVGAVTDAARKLHASDPQLPILSNTEGGAVTSGQAFLDSLIRQITHPVRWDLCQENMGERGINTTIELAPGGVLSGLARRTMADTTTIAVKKPEDLSTAVDAIKENR